MRAVGIRCNHGPTRVEQFRRIAAVVPDGAVTIEAVVMARRGIDLGIAAARYQRTLWEDEALAIYISKHVPMALLYNPL